MRNFRYLRILIAVSTWALFAPTTSVLSQGLCPERPNVLLFLMDDFGWTSLPLLNPPIQWRDGEPENGPANYRSAQSPTFNRLDARMCATEEDGAVDECPVALRAEEADALSIVGWVPDRQVAAPPEDGVTSYNSEFCEGVDSCDEPQADVLPFHGALRRLAERGTSFTHFYAASAKCLPSRAALVTGKHGNWTGSTDNGYENRIPREDDTFVKRLRTQGGYYTGLIGKWHATGEASRGRFHKFGAPEDPSFRKTNDTCKDGFDEAIWYDRAERGYFRGSNLECGCARTICSPAGPASCACNAIGSAEEDASPWAVWGDQEDEFYVDGMLQQQRRLTHNGKLCSTATLPGHEVGLHDDDKRFGCPYSPRMYADLAKDFLSRNARPRVCSTDPSQECLANAECAPGICTPPDKPFFLMVPFTSVHSGHDAPARTLAHYGTEGLPNRGRSSAYYAIMEETDAAIGAVLAHLEALGIDDETLVIFTSDQGPDGEELQFGSPTLNGTKGTVWEAGIRIPMIVRGCGQEQARVISDLGSHVDIYRTVLDAADVAVPPAGADGEDIDGRSWLPELQAQNFSPEIRPASPPDRRDFVFSRYSRSIAAISRAGFFDGTAPSPEWYALPEASGVCAFIGKGGVSAEGHFGVSRGPSVPLVLCNPDDEGEDAACEGLGEDQCRVVGKRCTGTEFGEFAHDRPRCHDNKDCPGSSTCEDEGPPMNVLCNVCVRASWKLKTADKSGGGPVKPELYELSSDPEESRNYSAAAGVSPSAITAVRNVERVLGGALDRWKCSCLDPPPSPFSPAVPMSGGNPGGTWEGRQPSCNNLLPECKTNWMPADESLYP